MTNPIELAQTSSLVVAELTVYHDEDFILAALVGGPLDGQQVRINVQTGLTMREGKAVLPLVIVLDGLPTGYKAWTIVDGLARYRWSESAEPTEGA